MDELCRMELPELRWVVQDLIPEGLVILAGRPKAGKSWLALKICLAVGGDGTVLGSLDAQTGEALYCALEDSPRRMKNRLRALGISTGSRSVSVVHDLPSLDNGGLAKIDHWLNEHPYARVVVIDTLQKVAPKRHPNADRYAEDYKLAGSLQKLAMKHSVTILVVHHTRKQRGATPLEEVSGTTALTGAADAILVLENNRSQIALYVTGRDIEQERTLRGEGSLASSQWILNDAPEYAPLSETRQAVIELLKQRGPSTSKEVAHELGMHEKTAASTLSRMQKDGQVIHRHGKYAVLPTANSENHANTATTAYAATHTDDIPQA